MHDMYIVVSLYGNDHIRSIYLYRGIHDLGAEAGLCRINRNMPDDRAPVQAIAIPAFNNSDSVNMDVLSMLTEANVQSVALVPRSEFHEVAEWVYPTW